MKAVICCLNSKYIHASLAPWCLLAGVRKYCKSETECEIVESTINRTLKATLNEILQQKPQLVGFCTYIWNINQVSELGKMLKAALPEVKIVLGGPEVSYRPENALKNYTFADYILSGEGEYPFAMLCDALCFGNSISTVPALSYFANANRTGLVLAEAYISQEEPPSPYTEEFFKRLGGRICYIETSRGCPFNCDFCLSGRCGNVRMFGLEKAKSEILALSHSGTKTIKFVDRTFNANPKRALEIFKFIIDNYGNDIPLGVCFHFEIAGDILTDEIINTLGTAPVGAIQLEIGMQSFNEKTLAAIHRKTNTAKLVSNIKRLVEFRNMHIHIDLIAGLPYEDTVSFERSFNTGFLLNSDMLQMGFLKLLYGAPMREQSYSHPCAFSDEPPYEVIATKWLSKEEIKKLKNTEDALERLCNSGRFKLTLGYLLNSSGFSPFRLFCNFGNAFVTPFGTPLAEYVVKIFEYFAKISSVNADVLRDLLVADLLLASSATVIPEVLKRPDSDLKICRRLFKVNQKSGTKTGTAILYTAAAVSIAAKFAQNQEQFINTNCSKTEKAFIAVDYSKVNPITGRYNYKIFSVSKLIDE